MKILHAACLTRPSPGILKQMIEEQKAANELNITWDVVYYLPQGYGIDSLILKEANHFYKENFQKDKISKIIGWIGLKTEYYYWLWKVSPNYDIILTRYSVHDPFLLLFLIFKINKVFTVHHSVEVDELQSEESFYGKIRANLEKLTGFLCIKLSDGIIAVTDDIIDYERNRIMDQKKKGFLYSNGILLKETFERNLNHNNIKPNLLFVASEFVNAHGLDLLLENMKKDKSDFVLHLVGNIIYEEDLNNITKDPRIIYHGIRSSDYIQNLAQRCDVALGSFSIERKGLKEASTLKVREYLSFGLPVYSGHKDVFPNEFIFYHIGKPIISDILKYQDKMKNYSKSEVRKKSVEYIDKKTILKNLYQNLIRLCS